MKQKLLICCWLLAVGCCLTVDAKMTLPQLFQSGMVLQRGKPVPIWGKANAGEQIVLSWQKKQYTATADAEGRWRVDLPKMKAGGPYTLEVKSEGENGEKLVFEDVMVGDVWLLSGQSNIDVTIERVYPQYVDEIEAFNIPQVRLFRVQNETNTHGVQDDIRRTNINWKPLTKQNAWLFSAVGSFLGKRMWEKNKVPQGIIVNSWGGTPIEAWISADSLMKDYPMLIKRLAFYQNDQYVRAQAQANNEANKRWSELLDKVDGASSYQLSTYKDDDWKTIDQNNWTWRGTGSVWLRQHVNIDKEHAGKPARLLLGTLFDQDITYMNGKEIGHTYYQYPPRRYDIPEGLLREGDNVIAVRFINKYGAVHFIPEKPYLIAFGDDRFSQNPMPKDVIPLGKTWKMHVGAEMPSCPSGDVSLQNIPTTLYNAVLYPLAPYAINGIVWYQGESNTGNPTPYADYLKKLMGCWRDRWQEQLPFCIVQLANYDGRQQTGNPRPITPEDNPVNSNWARLREAQRLTAKADARAELAVINDLGETVDIHPLRKKEVAERVGLCFDRLIYNNKVKLSPEVVSIEVQDNSVVLTLDQPVQAGTLFDFELAGPDGRFLNTEAEVLANNPTAIILRKAVTMPKKVRYAWKDNPTRANVRNLSGLPMSSFEMNF
ncbi:MAG: sialate O-acetylesterase [Prevotella sp.]|nr:sialate O-acetylesterase [Prevotella sp.]